MTEQPLHRRPDDELVEALHRLEPEIDWPQGTPGDGAPDTASIVRARIDAHPPTGARGSASRVLERWITARGVTRPPLQHALLIALAALLTLAAFVGAAGIDLPGIRVFFGTGPVSPPPSLAPDRSASPSGPGFSMGLGSPISPADQAAADTRAGFHVLWPTDPDLGQPDAAYVDPLKSAQISLVWASRPGLPATLEPGVGLVLSEFLGKPDVEFFGKVVGSGTTVNAVRVNGQPAYWISGSPHFFFYVGPNGSVFDERRWVGDALLWSNGQVTYRLESALGRDTTIRIAESLR